MFIEKFFKSWNILTFSSCVKKVKKEGDISKSICKQIDFSSVNDESIDNLVIINRDICFFCSVLKHVCFKIYNSDFS